MTPALHPPALLHARNPATGAVIDTFDITPAGEVDGRTRVLSQRAAAWAARPLRERLGVLSRWIDILSRDAERWVDLIRGEIGKPRVEALVEVVATLDALRWTVRHARRVLRETSASPGIQRLLMIGRARVRRRPHGVVGMIGTWNYPLLLNAAPLSQALAAGNAAIWKPSELATACGAFLHQNLVEAGIAPDVVGTVYGAGDVGQALIDSPITHCVFTGGIGVGRAVLERLGSRGVPAVAELSGFDPAILLPDADREATVRRVAWAAFVSAGQTCVAVKRVYVLDNVDDWRAGFERVARLLRVGDPSHGEVDLGPLICEAARERFIRYIGDAVNAGATLAAGGVPLDGPGHFVAPTVLVADDDAPERALAGVFGPVVVLRQVKGIDDAVTAANAGPYGLAASVWGRDRRLLRQIASRLDAGVVTINDAVTPAGHAEAPFGGVKASGYGRTRGAIGLLEFTQPVAIHERRHAGWCPQVFPYTKKLWKLLWFYKKMVHRG